MTYFAKAPPSFAAYAELREHLDGCVTCAAFGARKLCPKGSRLFDAWTISRRGRALSRKERAP